MIDFFKELPEKLLTNSWEQEIKKFTIDKALEEALRSYQEIFLNTYIQNFLGKYSDKDRALIDALDQSPELSKALKHYLEQYKYDEQYLNKRQLASLKLALNHYTKRVPRY